MLDELDRCLVCQHTGPEDERYVRVLFLGNLERLPAREIGQAVVGQDDLWPEGGQLLDERRLRVNDNDAEVKARPDQEALGQFGAQGFVLQDQDADDASR